MADYDFPADLLELQRRFLALEAAGEVTPEMTDVAVRLSGHPWWAESGDRFKARTALRELAQAPATPPLRS